MIYIFLTIFSFAADLPGESLFEAAPKMAEAKPPELKTAEPVIKNRKTLKQENGSSNLPGVYLGPLARESTESILVTPPKGSVEIFQSIKVGESISVEVLHSIIAFPDEKAPVVAILKDARFRGLKLIGESHLEKNSRRIFLDFSKLVVGNKIYNLKAVGVSSSGQPGLTGEHHSRESEYFAGDFISSFVAGYFDGLVPRKTNAFGQVEQDSTVDTAVKKGLASGALSSSERFREKLKKVPEFSEIQGPLFMDVLILDQAISSQ